MKSIKKGREQATGRDATNWDGIVLKKTPEVSV